MNYVRPGKVDDAVVVGMRGRNVDRLDLFAIEMDRKRIVESNDGQPCFSVRLVPTQSLSHIGVGNDMCFAAQLGVTTRMVAVMMGIENEFKLSGIQLL